MGVPKPTPDAGTNPDDGGKSKGVKADTDSIKRFANHKVQGWSDDAKEAHGKVEKTSMREYSFSDTEGGRLYGSIYAAAQRTYQDVLHRAHGDIADAKQALLDSAKVMDEHDDQAKARMAALQQKWSSDAGFRSATVSEKTAEANRKAINKRTQAATEAGSQAAEAGQGGDGQSGDGTGGTGESRTTKDGDKQYKSSR